MICCSRNFFFYSVEYIFSGFYDEYKDHILSEIKSFCNIIQYPIQKHGLGSKQ